jgi:hypothetical protein
VIFVAISDKAPGKIIKSQFYLIVSFRFYPLQRKLKAIISQNGNKNLFFGIDGFTGFCIFLYILNCMPSAVNN